MCSIITGCSGTIVVNLAIRYKKIEKQCGEISYFIIKHECDDFKHIDFGNI